MKTDEANPLFYFYYVETPGVFGANEIKPSDFTLLKFEQKNGKREITTMSSNIVSNSVGTDEHAKRAFTAEKVKPGEYRLTLTAPLAAGEYAFQRANGLFYTFSVQPKL